MKPPKREKGQFEKVKVGEFINGIIQDVEYDNEHKFTYKGEAKVSPAVRFALDLDGYAFPHRSRWLNFSYGERSNLYKKFLVKLVENAQPDMDFDLDCLKGMRVKTIWAEQNDFQFIDSIFPEGQKVPVTATPQEETGEEVDLGPEPDLDIDPEELERFE